MLTAIPPTLSPICSTSPVCRPARTWIPRSRTAATVAIAQRIAAGGPVERREEPVARGVDLRAAIARKLTPNPRVMSLDASPSIGDRRVMQRVDVESTMSVNRTVARNRSSSASCSRNSLTKRSISCSIESYSPTQKKCASPGNSSSRAPGDLGGDPPHAVDREIDVTDLGEQERGHVDGRQAHGVTLISRFIRESEIAAPGLAACRRYEASHVDEPFVVGVTRRSPCCGSPSGVLERAPVRVDVREVLIALGRASARPLGGTCSRRRSRTG